MPKPGKAALLKGIAVTTPRQVYEDDYTRGEAQARAQSTGFQGFGSGLIKTHDKSIPGAPPVEEFKKP